MMRSVFLLCGCVVIGITTTFALAQSAWRSAPQKTCDVHALTESVGDASRQLQNMKQVYGVALKKQLNILKQQKGWTDSEFFMKGQHLVRNDKIAAFDDKNRKILASIQQLGHASERADGNCHTLRQLNSRLNQVISITKAKWDYMFYEIRSASQR